MKRKYKRTGFSLRLLCLVLALSLPHFVRVAAQENAAPSLEQVLDARRGIVWVEARLSDRSGDYVVKGQTGFLIGDENGAAHVVTAYQSLLFSEEEKKYWKEQWRGTEGVRISQEEEEKRKRKEEEKKKREARGEVVEEEEENQSSYNDDEPSVELEEETYQVIQNGDIRTTASLNKRSSQRNLAILNLSTALNADLALELATDDKEISEKLWLCGFPAGEGERLFSEETTSLRDISYSGKVRENESDWLLYQVSSDKGYLGAPVVDIDGDVVGIQVSSEGEGARALSVSELRKVLDEGNIRYKSYKAAAQKKISKIVIALGIVIAVLFVLLVVRLLQLLFGRLSGTDSIKTQMAKKEAEAGGQTAVSARILRLNTRETLPVTHVPFYMGSGSSGIDYMITGNPGISRVHACIIREGRHFELVDLNSSNGTFIGNERAVPNRKYPLQDGASFRLCDENFVFRC